MVEKGIDDALVKDIEIKVLNKADSDNFINHLKDLHEIDSSAHEKIDEKSTYPKLAFEFLKSHGLYYNSMPLIINQNETLYIYRDGKYESLSVTTLKNWLMKWLAKKSDKLATTCKRDGVLAVILAITEINPKTKFGTYLNSEEKSNDAFTINLRNGLLTICSELITVSSHDPLFFSNCQLPFSYDEKASCPTFERFLARVQPDQEIRYLLQEWLGYNLIYWTDLEAFVIHLGDGKNGKSVFSLIQTCLLGKENVSAVGLEGFNPQSRFTLAQTKGKLANVIEEINRNDKAAEGILKQFVSGQDLMVEEKYKTPYRMTPTARVTALANNLPKFNDSSNGLWRRLILVPWSVVIPDEEVNLSYRNPNFWTPELPGIFNWATDGLKRLLIRGHFLIPEAIKNSVSDFKKERNPIHEFLVMHFCEDPKSEIPDTLIYRKYQNFCQESGEFIQPKRSVNSEVPRIFKNAVKTKNPRNFNGTRCRYWIGIRLSETPTHGNTGE